jgi:uncharacterized protein (TIGR02271 family)
LDSVDLGHCRDCFFGLSVVVLAALAAGSSSMLDKAPVIVWDSTGLRGVATAPTMNGDETSSQVLIAFEGHKQVLVPWHMLTLRTDGSYALPFAVAELDARAAETTQTKTVIPVVEEQVQVDKRTVETGKVRIKKVVHEQQETIDIPLLAEEIEVQRVAVNRNLDKPVSVRYEGDTLIIPLLEEVLVVQKQLRLKEEVHITKKPIEKRQPQQVTLRREAVTVDPDNAPVSQAQA